MKKNIIFWNFALSLFAFGCSPLDRIIKDDLRIVYKSEDGEALILDRNKFYLVDLRSRYKLGGPCCDTLAIGEWKTEGNSFLVLTSPVWLSSHFVQIEVSESVKTDKDSVYFLINSPMDLKFRKINPEKSELIYSLQIDALGKGFGYFGRTSDLEKNVVVFQNSDKAQITKFTLFIKPKMNLDLTNLETLGLISQEYKVRNLQANVFEINIPHLDYNYLTLKRLNDDYGKIVNKNVLRWNGKDYIKE